jgi:AraC-like DNA-binding protein
LVFAITVRAVSLSSSGQFFPLAASAPGVSQPELAPVVTDVQDTPLLDTLRRLMEEDRIYRAEGLSIAALALKMGIPEYRLRRLINQRLGHRNFSSFVNRYRLADAMTALRDPAQAVVPILTIALDAGFQSLGPFNRAFKAETGLTPTEYRRRHAVATENSA